MSSKKTTDVQPYQNRALYMFKKEYFWRGLVTVCGLFIILLTVAIGLFLMIRGTGTFIKFHHTVWEFLFSSNWAPMDSATEGGGRRGRGDLYLRLPFDLRTGPPFCRPLQPRSGNLHVGNIAQDRSQTLSAGR